MKNSYDIEQQLAPGKIEMHRKLLSCDQNEIDNPDKVFPLCLQYLDRIGVIISKIKKHFPVSHEVKIGDFGCAQGNVSLILAEYGYKVFAVDINPTFLEYAKLKYERGDINWIAANIEDVDLPPNSLDIGILGECIEHCAYPEEIIRKALIFIRPGGLLIVTTPNGDRVKTGLPTFRQVIKKEQREPFEEKQFGPDGEHHLFLFTLDEIPLITPKNSKVIETGYLGSTIFINKYSYNFLRFLPVFVIRCLIRIGSKIPIMNSKTYNNIYFLLVKRL